MSRSDKLPRNPKIQVCVVEWNPLAATHLARLLKGRTGITLLPWDVPEGAQSPMSSQAIVVIDKETLPVSLNVYIQSVRAKFAEVKFIVIGRQCSLKHAREVLDLGVSGLLTHEDVEKDLLPAIRSVWQGHLWLRSDAFSRQIARADLLGETPNLATFLTLRERQIIELLGQRLSNKEIASELKISESTVKFHISNVFSKLGVRDRNVIADMSRRLPRPKAKELNQSA
jgi:DNA-binding NarL/FixJ family response regulator